MKSHFKKITKNELENFGGYICNILKKITKNRIKYNCDLIQDGYYGLLKASKDYNKIRPPVKFTTFAYSYVTYRIIDSLRNELEDRLKYTDPHNLNINDYTRSHFKLPSYDLSHLNQCLQEEELTLIDEFLRGSSVKIIAERDNKCRKTVRKIIIDILYKISNYYGSKLSPQQIYLNIRSLNSVKHSKFKGVTKLKKKWAARVCVKNKKIHIGVFDTEIDAAKTYNEAVIKYCGDKTNDN